MYYTDKNSENLLIQEILRFAQNNNSFLYFLKKNKPQKCFTNCIFAAFTIFILITDKIFTFIFS